MDYWYISFKYNEMKPSCQNLQILPTQKKTRPYIDFSINYAYFFLKKEQARSKLE